MKKIGITGGVGAGKSRVLAFLEERYQAAVYEADKIAHQVQEPGEDCYRAVAAHFGQGILTPEGAIDRKKLGRIVFSDQKELAVLNGIVHPAVNRRIRELMALEEKKGTALFILEAALLTQPVYREMLDEIWYIHVDVAVREARLAASRGYAPEQTAAMMASQPEEAEFTAACDHVIENGGAFEETKRQIEALLAEVKN